MEIINPLNIFKDLLCNKSNSGFIQTKLKNDRVKRRKLHKDFEGGNAEEACESSEIYEKLELLRTLSGKDNENNVKDILKLTLAIRWKEKKELFHCFISNPNLVS